MSQTVILLSTYIKNTYNTLQNPKNRDRKIVCVRMNNSLN